MPRHKQKINNLEGLNDPEFKEYLKIVGGVAPVRVIKGRSKDGILLNAFFYCNLAILMLITD